MKDSPIVITFIPAKETRIIKNTLAKKEHAFSKPMLS